MADHGCAVAGYDKDQTKVEALRKESAERNIRAWRTSLISLECFVNRAQS